MKRLALALAVTLVAASSSAADIATLTAYATKSLPRCPGGNVTLQPINENGPAGFRIYTATLKSSDEYCGTQKYLLHSPKTDQTLIGSIILLAADARPVTQRVADQAGQALKSKVTAQVSPFPLPDGLKAVTILRVTPFGNFPYHGFVDASERFLLIGFRGSLKIDPAKTLRDSIGVENGVRRGAAAAKTEIIELSDFQCPTCAKAHKALEPIIQKNLGKINYVRIDLPLFEHHEWSVQAALGGKAIQKVAPAKYWEYVDYVFANQEEIGKQKFDTVLKNWVEDRDLKWSAIEKIYRDRNEQQAILDQVARSFDLGINSTPTFIINGQVMGYGPEGSFTINSIRQAVGLPPEPVKKPAAPAPKKK